MKLGEWYYFGWSKQASRFGDQINKIEKWNYKMKQFKDTQEYQVEAYKNGWKEAYNKKLKEEWYDGIQAFNKAFDDYEYNFFTDIFNK